jgi:MoaA/NifB/PqqE/SkfB family radical SAM enzyme
MTSSAATSRLDRARRLAFALRVFGRRPSAANLRAALHRQRVLRLEGREAPVAVVLGLTYRCQCACEHCSVEAGPGRQRDDELSTAKLEDLLRQIRALGALKVSFFGGEPLLHPDVHHLASLGAALGLRISIDTNGILLDQGCVDALVRSRVSNVNISIDSPDPAEHDRLRRHPGAFQAALAGLQRLRRAGIPALISTYVTQRSLREGDFDRTVALARAQGAAGVKVLLPMVAGRWQERPDQALGPEDEALLRAKLDPGYSYVEDALQNVKDGSLRCTAVNRSFVYISPSGELQPCPAVPVRFADLRTEPLGEAVARMWSHAAFAHDCGICAMNDDSFRRRVGLPLAGEGDGRRMVDAP